MSEKMIKTKVSKKIKISQFCNPKKYSKIESVIIKPFIEFKKKRLKKS